MSNYKNALTVRRLIDFLEMVEDKDKKILVTSLGDFEKAYAIIAADNIEVTTNGIPAVYLCMED